MGTLKPYSITADNLDDLKMQLNDLLDKQWSMWDNITGYAKTQTLQGSDSGNQAKQAVTSDTPNVAVSNVQSGSVDASTTNLSRVTLTGAAWQSNFPKAGTVGWNKHTLTYEDKTIDMNAGTTDKKYICWKQGQATYTFFDAPFDTLGFFIIAFNDSGTLHEVWNNTSVAMVAYLIATHILNADQIQSGVLRITNGTTVDSSFGGDKDGNRDGNAYFYNKDTGEVFIAIGKYYVNGVANSFYINGNIYFKNGLLVMTSAGSIYGQLLSIQGEARVGSLVCTNNLEFLNLTSNWIGSAPPNMKYAPVLQDADGVTYFIPVYYY